MTRHPGEHELDLFRDRCRAHGLRVTPQRIAIYEDLRRAKNHPTAEQVHARVSKRFSTISLNTVNETLLTFARIGLVERVESFGSPRRYDPNLAPHHHVHCTSCGKILDFENDKFDRIEPPDDIAGDFDIVSSKVIMMGICSACQRKR